MALQQTDSKSFYLPLPPSSAPHQRSPFRSSLRTTLTIVEFPKVTTDHRAFSPLSPPPAPHRRPCSQVVPRSFQPSFSVVDRSSYFHVGAINWAVVLMCSRCSCVVTTGPRTARPGNYYYPPTSRASLSALPPPRPPEALPKFSESSQDFVSIAQILSCSVVSLLLQSAFRFLPTATYLTCFLNAEVFAPPVGYSSYNAAFICMVDLSSLHKNGSEIPPHGHPSDTLQAQSIPFIIPPPLPKSLQ